MDRFLKLICKFRNARIRPIRRSQFELVNESISISFGAEAQKDWDSLGSLTWFSLCSCGVLLLQRLCLVVVPLPDKTVSKSVPPGAAMKLFNMKCDVEKTMRIQVEIDNVNHGCIIQILLILTIHFWRCELRLSQPLGLRKQAGTKADLEAFCSCRGAFLS